MDKLLVTALFLSKTSRTQSLYNFLIFFFTKIASETTLKIDKNKSFGCDFTINNKTTSVNLIK